MDIYQERLKNFRELLKKNNIDVALVAKRENYLYLSGFTGSLAYLVITQTEAFLITDFRYIEQGKAEASSYEIIMYKESIYKTLKDIFECKELKKISKVLIEDDYLTLKFYNNLISNLPKIEIKSNLKIIESLRAIKDKYEIDAIKKAVKLTDDAFTYILDYIKEGVREFEIAARLEYFLKKNGASSSSFQTIVASGNRASMPHGVASDKKVCKGDMITLDFGAILNNYCSDMTRTVFLGEPEESIIKVYDIVLKAQKSAISKVKSGITANQLDAAARNIIDKHGYKDNFGHGLGHGVGIEVHEAPRVSYTSEEMLLENMVITIEPGIYLPNVGGVRIEDIVVINKEQCEILTGSSKDIIIL